MVTCAASRGEAPALSRRSTFSTTTMASSTTMPMASTRPNRERLFREKPKAAMTAQAPIREIGMARIGMIAARQLCRNIRMTRTTRPTAMISVFFTSSMEALTYSVGL